MVVVSQLAWMYSAESPFSQSVFREMNRSGKGPCSDLWSLHHHELEDQSHVPMFLRRTPVRPLLFRTLWVLQHIALPDTPPGVSFFILKLIPVRIQEY